MSSAVLAASSARRLGVNMANQMKKRVHAAKVRAADKTTLIVHPNVRKDTRLCTSQKCFCYICPLSYRSDCS